MKKGAFYIKYLAKVTLKFGKLNFRKWHNIIFSGPYKFCVAHVTHDITKEYLTFIKLKNST